MSLIFIKHMSWGRYFYNHERFLPSLGLHHFKSWPFKSSITRWRVRFTSRLLVRNRYSKRCGRGLWRVYGWNHWHCRFFIHDVRFRKVFNQEGSTFWRQNDFCLLLRMDIYSLCCASSLNIMAKFVTETVAGRSFKAFSWCLTFT